MVLGMMEFSSSSVPMGHQIPISRSAPMIRPLYLVDVGDASAFSRHIQLPVVGPQLTLDGEEQDLQVPLLLKPAEKRWQHHPAFLLGGPVLFSSSAQPVPGRQTAAMFQTLFCPLHLAPLLQSILDPELLGILYKALCTPTLSPKI